MLFDALIEAREGEDEMVQPGLDWPERSEAEIEPCAAAAATG
jgi:hypothetical protein